jgi:uncharacterized coiled-coil protein SlyX
MFDDLDLLAQRILQLATRMQVQNQTIDQLNQSIVALRNERDSLASQLQTRTEKLTHAETSLSATLSKVGDITAKAQADQLHFQGTLDLFKEEHSALQTQAKTYNTQLSRLREVNQSAQQRINRVLEQLPGATPSETA